MSNPEENPKIEEFSSKAEEQPAPESPTPESLSVGETPEEQLATPGQGEPPTPEAAEGQVQPEGSRLAEESPSVDSELREGAMEKLPGIEAQAAQGLGQLYDLLPRQGKITKEHLVNALQHTTLRELTPAPQKDLVHTINRQHLNEGAKTEFVSRGLDVLRDWIDTEAIKEAGDEWLEKRLAEK